ncbi:sensor histidine kinase [Vacuolonema iberomarrocanum]|uniref:sensor histidine kinase n=1 Tax=Vacuolonema iberomarrocanum TaxID=3454632 RepID=UPI001A0A1D40|nr:sensor histidine kinase [filamentous cyanobacterium LEGE 07170]
MAQALNLLYQRYRLIALAVYTAVLLAGLIDWIYGGIGPRAIVDAPENYRFLLFVVTLLTLIGLELWAVGKASFAMLNRFEFIPFFARIILFISACLVTDLSYSKILVLPILLYIYLAVSKRLSYFLAILGVATLLGIELANVSGMGRPPLPPSLVNGIPNVEFPSEIPNNRPLRGGRLIDEGMGSLITLVFTLLLARAMSQAIQSQQKLTGLLASLEASHIQLQGYATRVADLAATEERNRLARDIHDSLGHHLAAINIQLEKANAYRERDPNRAYEAVNHAQRTVQEALKDVRESVSSLRQDSKPFLFQEALNDLLRRMGHSELELTLTQTRDSSHYSRLKLMTLYRVIQEGLTNVHKHAGANQVAIALNFSPQAVTLNLTDNGSGFDVATWKSRGNEQATHGLVGLQERLSLVGGTLDITSRPQATTLTIKIPQVQSQAELLARLSTESLNTGQKLENP